MGYTGPVQFENGSHKKVPNQCIIADKKVLAPYSEKSTDPVQTFYAEGTDSIGQLATGHFSNQVGSGML